MPIRRVNLMAISYDRKSGAYTDGKHYVKAAYIRKFAKEKMGKSATRGLLSRAVLSAYFLDTFGVTDNE